LVRRLEAAQLAEQANQSSGSNRPDRLDAAYAESRWFPEAAAAQRKALELAKPETDRRGDEAMRARLALYDAGRPYRQMSHASAPVPTNP
jgi:hypothetical protein